MSLAATSLPLVFVNGERTASDAAVISARDRGFTLADGLFETMRAKRGVVFRLDRHLARLSSGLRTLSIPEPAELRSWMTAALADAGSTSDISVRLTVTRGPGAAGLTPPADPRPTVVIAVTPMPTFPASIYERGLRGHVASGRRNEHSITAGLKTIAYTDAVAAWLEAQRAGADEAIFLDTAGHCSEASAANLFIVTGNTLLTPPITCAALPGVTRATVVEIAGALGIAADERAFDRDALLSADEAFLTSSLRGIAPLTRVDGRAIGAGAPGPVTRQIAAAYRRLVDQECGAA